MWDVGDESVDEAGHAWMEMDEEEEWSASKIMFCSPHLIAAIFMFTSDRAALGLQFASQGAPPGGPYVWINELLCLLTLCLSVRPNSKFDLPS